MSKLNVVICMAACLSIFLFAGCGASEPTAANLMRKHAAVEQAQADLMKQLAEQWEKGNRMVASGENRIKEGEERVKDAENEMEKGRQEIEQGNREIEEGRRLIQESEQRFRESFPNLDINAGK